MVCTSGDVRDDEHIYFAHFGNEGNPWSGDVRLMALEVPHAPRGSIQRRVGLSRSA